MEPFDQRICALGEGPLWHPLRQELFWFDITGRRLLSHHPESGARHDLALPQMCSAAAWIDRDRLLVASDSALLVLDLRHGALTPLVDLEADNPVTRSNDGRCDPWGGFWIGTMGKSAEHGVGALYRFHQGELRRLAAGLSIPNAICFAPDRSRAYFADTAAGLLYRFRLDDHGWPVKAPGVLVDFSRLGLAPDGAVTDAEGTLWVALWGEGAVIRVSPDGTLGDRVTLPAPHSTCPAFGGPDLTTLYVTSATQGLTDAARAAHPLSGATFALPQAGQGRAEPAFLLTGDRP